MKFETNIGLGEICGYNENASRGDKRMPDVLVKVVAIHFELGGSVSYTVEHIGSAFGVQRFNVRESQLHSDPSFDQEAGCYPPEQE